MFLARLGQGAAPAPLQGGKAREPPVGATAVLHPFAFANGGDGSPHDRASLARAFETGAGARFVVNADHFKTKGSACEVPVAGDGQGNCNIVRTNAANRLFNWLATPLSCTVWPQPIPRRDWLAFVSSFPSTPLAAQALALLDGRCLTS